MEKSLIIILVWCFSWSLNAQDSLCVFSIKGSAYSKMMSSITPISKGMFITDKSTLLVNESSEITAINANGEAFQINKVGEYNFNTIIEQHSAENSKSLTSKYFKLIWDEFLKNRPEKTIIGGVFRGDVLMEFPKDSTKLASSKITFKWNVEDENKTYYLFVKNLSTDEIFKTATNGSELTLYKNQAIFSEGTDFEWMVSTSEFPNLKNKMFYFINLLSKAEYKLEIATYHTLIKDLKNLGLSETEIETSICETYGICK